jgi:CBS domain containing-hemolysin-like protein
LLIVVALVVVNAFFVAAEYALVRVRRTRMEALAAQGSGLARVVLHGLDHLSRYIAGVPVGITLAGLASGRFGEPVLAALFDPLFAQLFPPSLLGTEVRDEVKITSRFKFTAEVPSSSTSAGAFQRRSACSS